MELFLNETIIRFRDCSRDLAKSIRNIVRRITYFWVSEHSKSLQFQKSDQSNFFFEDNQILTRRTGILVLESCSWSCWVCSKRSMESVDLDELMMSSLEFLSHCQLELCPSESWTFRGMLPSTSRRKSRRRSMRCRTSAVWLIRTCRKSSQKIKSRGISSIL